MADGVDSEKDILAGRISETDWQRETTVQLLIVASCRISPPSNRHRRLRSYQYRNEALGGFWTGSPCTFGYMIQITSLSLHL